MTDVIFEDGDVTFEDGDVSFSEQSGSSESSSSSDSRSSSSSESGSGSQSSSSESSESSSSSLYITTIPADIHQPSVGNLVELWELHLTTLGGSIYRYTQNTKLSGGIQVAVAFGGATYYPRSFTADGFAHTARGQQPRPKVKIADVDGAIHTLCLSYQDMLGAVVKRRRTFSKYLDGEPLADPTAEFPIDVYEISKKLNRTKIHVEFELNPYMDKEGKKVPGRIILKDVCSFVYRYWDGSQFVYDTERPCPYKGVAYFKADDTSTGTASEDDCSRTLSGCKARYGTYGPLPFGGFPGVGLIRR